jgi:hypothetical protein
MIRAPFTPLARWIGEEEFGPKGRLARWVAGPILGPMQLPGTDLWNVQQKVVPERPDGLALVNLLARAAERSVEGERSAFRPAHEPARPPCSALDLAHSWVRK